MQLDLRQSEPTEAGPSTNGELMRDNLGVPSDGARTELFSALVPPLSGAVVRVAAALIGVDEAEDVAQEAILRAWQAWPTLRDTHAVRTWLLQITVNVCRAWQRGHYGTHRRRSGPLPTTSGPLATVLQQGGPDAWQHAEELDLHDALAQLPDELRAIVTLRYFGGLDASEIGSVLGAPPATVRTCLRRALGLLRTQLQPSGNIPATGRSSSHTDPGGPNKRDVAGPGVRTAGSSDPRGGTHAE
jgi:RNA polymerase sigma-70 factor (ECF subfamily)